VTHTCSCSSGCSGGRLRTGCRVGQCRNCRTAAVGVLHALVCMIAMPDTLAKLCFAGCRGPCMVQPSSSCIDASGVSCLADHTQLWQGGYSFASCHVWLCSSSSSSRCWW
jgi:hypothetical protein